MNAKHMQLHLASLPLLKYNSQVLNRGNARTNVILGGYQMKRHIVLLVIVSCLISSGPTLGRQFPPSRTQARQAEQPSQSHRPPPAISRSVAANSRFVYVLQGNELHQADAITLRWFHTVQLSTSDPDRPEDSRRKPLGQYGPWNRDLDMATSVDGAHFSQANRLPVAAGHLPVCGQQVGSVPCRS